MKAPSNSSAEGRRKSGAQPSPANDLKQTAASSQSEGCASMAPPRRDAGEAARTESEDYYVNEAGLVVFTERYLLARGYCCGNGCKHCPYAYEAVPEPKRSALLMKRKEHDL